MRDIYHAPDKAAAELRLKETLCTFEKKAPKFWCWLEGLAFYSRQREHWKKIRTVNVVELLNGEVKRRTRVIRLFPHEASYERLTTAVAIEIHEEWVSGKRYLTFEKERAKEKTTTFSFSSLQGS